MPKTIYIPEDARNSGIDITWTPSAGRLDIGGMLTDKQEKIDAASR